MAGLVVLVLPVQAAQQAPGGSSLLRHNYAVQESVRHTAAHILPAARFIGEQLMK
jgi:hypothetical protein